MRSFFRSILVIALALMVTSCFNKEQPNYQYFPNMYTSPSYEAYGDYPIFPQGKEALLPAEGTIPRGWEPFEYPNTIEGRKAAKTELKSPLPYTKRNLENGEKLYDIYCAICHGKKGDGKGPLSTRQKIMGIPGYESTVRDITVGDVYFTAYYGLNNMGSYASQTTHKERWQIAMHVMSLKRKLTGQPAWEYVTDTTTNAEHFDKEIDPVTGREAMRSRYKK